VTVEEIDLSAKKLNTEEPEKLRVTELSYILRKGLVVLHPSLASIVSPEKKLPITHR
jgi:hypothetical protein